MRNILIGGLATFALTLIPVSVQAQSFEPIPPGICPLVVNYICSDRTSEGEILLYAIPDGYDYRYLLMGTKLDGYNLIYMWDTKVNQTVAYILVDDEANLAPSIDGTPSIDGNLALFNEVQLEIVTVLSELMLY